VYAHAASLPGLKVVGIDVHIGSQLTELEPFRLAYEKVAELTEALRAEGHDITRLDLGGGLGIPYTRSNDAPPLPVEYGQLIKDTLGHLGCEIEIEPGRLIAGNAGLMVSKVIYVKEGEGRDFLIVDGAMNDLIRPAMYEAHHDIIPVVEPEAGVEPKPYDIVGPVCETGDTFAKQRNMPPLAAEDLIAFRSAGAYGAVMASEYNTRPLIPEVLVSGDQFAVIRRRPTFDEMINRDTIPEWL
jgi:diaminopimelate decarboxylase